MSIVRSRTASSRHADSNSHRSEIDDLLLSSFDGSLRNFSCACRLFFDALDDSDSDGLTHIAHCEAAQGRIIRKGLHAHWLRRLHLHDTSVTRLDELGALLSGLASATVDLLDELGELASNVGSVAVENWSVSGADLARVVENDDLGVEESGAHGGVVLAVTGDVTTANLLDGDVLDVEADVVTGDTLGKLLVVHLDGLDFSGHTSGREGDDHTGLDDTSLDTTDGNRSNTTDLVDILEGKTEGLVGRTGRRLDGIDGLEEGLAGGLASLGLLLPTLVPWAVGGVVDHVVTVETRDGDESHRLGVVANLLDEAGGLLDDLVVTVLRPLGGVHLVDSNDELLHSESVGKQSVLTSLAILGDTSLELTSTGGNDENGAIGLGGTSDHVLDEITVTGSIDDGHVVTWGLELPESNVDGDTTLTLGLQLVKNPSILEGTLAEFGGFLLELLDSTLVNTTALVDQVTGGGRLSGVDVSDDNDVDVKLLLTHDDGW